MKPLLLVAVSLIALLALPSCTTLQPPVFTPDGCIEWQTERDEETGRSYALGACQDGRSYVAWLQRLEDGSDLKVAAVRKPEEKLFTLGYYVDGGFVEWSPKSGLIIEWVPPVVDNSAL